MLQLELSRFDQLYLQNHDWPVNEFHHWDTVSFLPLRNEEKVAVLHSFSAQSVALTLWQTLQLLLLGEQKIDAEKLLSLFSGLPFLQQNMLYSQLMRANFVGHAMAFDYAPLYQQMIRTFCHQSAEFCQVEELRGDGNEDIVVLLTNQFVTAQHGPTLTVLNYASALRSMGKHPVVICCTSVAKSSHYVYPMPAPVFFGTVRNEYFQGETLFDLDKGTQQPQQGGSAVKCWDQLFDFMQLTPIDDQAHLIDLVNFINQLNPRYIIGVGGLNPVLEFIAKSRPVLNVPCVTSLITPLYAVPVLHREYTESDRARIDQLQLKHPVLTSRLPFRLRKFDCRKSSKVTDAVIKFAIVGYRLEHEMREDFIGTLLAIKNQFPQSAFVMIGPDEIESLPHQLRLCSYFSGRVSNAIDLIANCHFMLNPKRQGGGTSAIEALSLEIPVLTEAYGDVYQYIGDQFVFCSDQQRLDFIRRYLTDAEFEASYNQACVSTAAMATDSSAIVQQLMLDYDSYIYQLHC
ncbi:MAG: glycosyltransferase [Pararheinheimera sp.]|nr:glycosyltransferase [Rheinheimera sp.]